MPSKKILNNLDTGLWTNYSSGYIASASGILDWNTGKCKFVLSYHQGEMPAFNSDTFDTVDELEKAMRRVESDLRKWKISHN